MIHEETGIEVSLDHTGSEVVDAPRASSTGTDGGNGLFEIETGLVAVDEALDDTDHVGGDEDLVDHLGVLTAASGTHVADVGSHALEQGEDLFVGGFLTTDHDGELGVSGTDVATADGSIEGFDSLGLSDLKQLGGEGWLGGGHINVDASLLEAVEDTLLADGDVLDISGIADDGEDDIGVLADLLRRVAKGSALLDKRVAFAQSTVELETEEIGAASSSRRGTRRKGHIQHWPDNRP